MFGLVTWICQTVPTVFSFAGFESAFADALQTAVSPESAEEAGIPENAMQTIETLNFKNVEIKDILRAIAEHHNINIFIDDAIKIRTTIRLSNITVHEVIVFLARKHGLTLNLENSIYTLELPEIPEPAAKEPQIVCVDGRMTLDLKNDPIEHVIHAIQRKSGKNIVVSQGVSGPVSGYLQDIEFEKGLNTLMRSNGFQVRETDGIYVIDREYRTQGMEKPAPRSFWIDVLNDSLIHLDVHDAELGRVVLECANRAGVDLFILSPLKEKVNARCEGFRFHELLDFLFKGTNLTYRNEKGVYLIGDKSVSGIASTELIELNHIKADGIVEILPADMTSKATIQVIKEHNSLMVVGTRDIIREVEGFIDKIDHPIPQILIEAIVVDFTTTDIFELGLQAWESNPADSNRIFDNFFPFVDLTANRDQLQRALNYYGSGMGIRNIGQLPAGFMSRLRALESTGKANIRSVPQIATLNGHAASIKIGTTQYYQLESYSPIVGGNTAFKQTSQRFEKITAEISLTITPWVSASGEITTEIKPEFSTPRGFDPDIPPTIDHRILESTVRLRDGETIILGGLIQDDESENLDKFPILGDIPYLGQLFRNRSSKNIKSKLMIYITPHLMYAEKKPIDLEGIME